MKIKECLWLDKFVDKIIKGEDLFIGFGRTDAGRYLSILMVLKKDKRALVISARDMTKRERRKYGES